MTSDRTKIITENLGSYQYHLNFGLAEIYETSGKKLAPTEFSLLNLVPVKSSLLVMQMTFPPAPFSGCSWSGPALLEEILIYLWPNP